MNIFVSNLTDKETQWARDYYLTKDELERQDATELAIRRMTFALRRGLEDKIYPPEYMTTGPMRL